MKILIGLDAEFMALSRKGKFAFPLMERELSGFGCDEMGHCLESRPEPAQKAQELIFNIMRSLARLPLGYRYVPENMIAVLKEDYFKLLKEQGSKEIPNCVNIYDKEILDDDAEYDRKTHRPLFCGMHVHISAYEEFEYGRYDEEKGHCIPEMQKTFIKLPRVTLVKLFDKYIFDALKDDPRFVAGRYRQPGFYEDKSHGGFEYRSLGSTAFTPKRVAIIFEMVKTIVENHDMLANPTDKKRLVETALEESKTRLSRTRPATNLFRAWVYWK